MLESGTIQLQLFLSKAGVFVAEGTTVRKLQARVIVLNDVWGAALRKRDGVWASVGANEMLDRQDFAGNRLFLRPPRRWGGYPTGTRISFTNIKNLKLCNILFPLVLTLLPDYTFPTRLPIGRFLSKSFWRNP
jgi:hypothetical protein